MNFRTACEDDADVIETFVNNFFDFECGEVESSSPSSSSSSANLTRGTPFRAKGPRITKDEIETDLVEGDTNWIVLEDMESDDDDILGCARMKIDNGKSMCYIDLFAHCVIESENENVTHKIKALLMKHLETVATTLGVGVICFEVQQYNEEMQTFLRLCGYKDARGRAMNESEKEKIKPILPCMLLSYEKKIIKKGISSRDDVDDEILEVEVVEGSTAFEKATSGPVFEGLMSDLFGALRAEYNTEKM